MHAAVAAEAHRLGGGEAVARGAIAAVETLRAEFESPGMGRPVRLTSTGAEIALKAALLWAESRSRAGDLEF